MPRLGGGLLQAMQILHIFGSARVTDTLYQSHCVLVILLMGAIFADRIEPAQGVDVSRIDIEDTCSNQAINLHQPCGS